MSSTNWSLFGSDRAHRRAPFDERADRCGRERGGRGATLQPCAARRRFHASHDASASSASSASASRSGNARSSWRRSARSSRARFAAIVGESCSRQQRGAPHRRDRLRRTPRAARRAARRARHWSSTVDRDRRSGANRSHCRCATSARSASTSTKWLCTDRADTPARPATSCTLGRRMPVVVAGEQRVDDRLAVALPRAAPGRRPPSRRPSNTSCSYSATTFAIDH